MPRDSDISIYTEKPDVFIKNIIKFIDRMFDSIARCNRLTKNFFNNKAMKKNKLNN